MLSGEQMEAIMRRTPSTTATRLLRATGMTAVAVDPIAPSLVKTWLNPWTTKPKRSFTRQKMPDGTIPPLWCSCPPRVTPHWGGMQRWTKVDGCEMESFLFVC